MSLYRIFCVFGYHRPDRHKVRHDGYGFVGKCKYCATPMIRIGPRNWKAAQPPADQR